MMKATIDIYLGEMYYGSIRMMLYKPPFTRTEEDIRAEIEHRLPRLKKTKYTIKIL